MQIDELQWIPLKTDGQWAGGFCKILKNYLETAGVETSEVFYEGRTTAVVDQSPTELTLKIPADPRVPEFEEVRVTCFDNSTLEAHQCCARLTLNKVC